MPELVALKLPYGPGFVETLEGLWEQGHAVLPLDPRLGDFETSRLLDEMRPARLITPEGEQELPAAPGVDPGMALVICTSGTTGPPKGVELSHDALRASAQSSIRRLDIVPGDRWLCCLPLCHIAGLMILVRSRLTHTPPVLLPRFDLEGIATETDINLISVVPTMLKRLLDASVDLTRFRWILVGGGPAPATLLQQAGAAGARVITTYGMTETCGGAVYDGVALEGAQVKLSPEGEIALQGPMLMRAYRAQPELSAQALQEGWFHTADLGEIDAAGRLRVLGRRDGLILTGAELVAPPEVEAVLREHPQVAGVRVVAAPDPEWGERVVAMVVPAAGVDPPDLQSLRAFALERLAPHKAPRELVLIENPASSSSHPLAPSSPYKWRQRR